MARFHRLLHPELPIHVTARSNNREHFPLPLEVVWEILGDHLYLLRHESEIRIHNFVLMPNHLHMVCSDPKGALPKGMQYFMRETSREMGRKSGLINRIWGGPYHTSIIRSPVHAFHAYRYLYRNPVAARLCERVEDYPFSSLRILLGFEFGIIPLEPDPLLFDQQTEETLHWLNTSLSLKERALIKSALRKRNFELARDPSTHKESSLNHWESLPIGWRTH